MYSACRRLLFQVRLNKPYQRFVWQSFRETVFGDFINFSHPIFFIFIFEAFAIQTKFIFSCYGITLTALEETEYIGTALRDFAKSLRESKNFFFQRSVFTFVVKSIISFHSFSKGPWKLNKTIFYYLEAENLIYLDQIETGLASIRICSGEEESRDILLPQEGLTCQLDLPTWPPTLISPVSLSRYGDRLMSLFFFGKTSEPLRQTSLSRKSSCCVRLIQSTLDSFNFSAGRTPVFLSLGEP